MLQNDETFPLFMAAKDATEEAIFNSLFAAKMMIGRNGKRVEALPLEKVIPLLRNIIASNNGRKLFNYQWRVF